jgi:hypothetical protein
VAEWRDGIEQFMEWANRARRGETSDAAAVEADGILMAFSQGARRVQFSGLALWAVCALRNLASLIREGHWHLVICRWCNRWVLAKDQRRTNRPSCRRHDCTRASERHQKACERQVQRDRDRARLRLA